MGGVFLFSILQLKIESTVVTKETQIDKTNTTDTNIKTTVRWGLFTCVNDMRAVHAWRKRRHEQSKIYVKTRRHKITQDNTRQDSQKARQSQDKTRHENH